MSRFSRREFLVRSGKVAVGFSVAGSVHLACEEHDNEDKENATGQTDVTADSNQDSPLESTGYILVDTVKCQGCASCMLACSLVHEGVENLSLSRIQVIQSAFAEWSDELSVEQCRQCVSPKCVEACQYDAARIDEDNGNVRAVDESKCIGCGACFQACPHSPKRLVIAEDEESNSVAKSLKCDLCTYAPHHWDEAGGGPSGKQACVEVCPVGAIAFSAEVPDQNGDSGYKINLRGANWAALGYPRN